MKSEVSSQSKILIFIKTKPILFGLIVIGVVAVITLVIILPVILTKKDNDSDKGKKENNDYILPEYYNVIPIGKEKIFDFNTIKATSDAKYTIINSKSNTDCDKNLDCFCTYLQGISQNSGSSGITFDSDKEKVYLTYKWVTDNIAYDAVNYLNNREDLFVYSPEEVFNKKVTVCSGYARLFTKLLICMGFDENNIKNIQGYAKGYSYNPDKTIGESETNHEWNAVKLEEGWCLIDSTWGAGSIDNTSFKKSYSEYYLCTPPGQLVRSHLPQNKELQFLDNPIEVTTFQKLVYTGGKFYEYGFEGIAYDEAVQNICGRGRIVLKFDENIETCVLFSFKKDGELKNDYISSKKYNNNYYYIDFYINEQGDYDLSANAKLGSCGGTHYTIAKFKFTCDSAPNEKYSFPIFYEEYKDQIELISPLYRKLENGHIYNFKVFDSVHEIYILRLIVNSSIEDNLMDKEGNYFIKNDVMLNNCAEVLIGYKESTSDSFHALLVYVVE